jgi:isopentenyl-diphosphate delta-isomerase
MNTIEKRKQNHIEVSLEKNVEANIGTGFKDIHLLHRALPEIDLDEVDTTTKFFGKKLNAPLIISAITGGTNEGKDLNNILATVAEKMGIGIGVGSQRIAIEKPETEYTFKIVREKAPNALIFANIGCPQLSLGWGIKEAKKAVEMIKGDALSIHMNPLQEAVQVNGDTNYSGILEKISELSKGIKQPLIMKETGSGISYEDAMKIEKAGAKGLEISGVGGTSWSAVEYHIAKQVKRSKQEYLGKALWNWGIPTAISVVETRKRTKLKIIASGGIRTGTEIAKSIVLGADAVGVAKPFLKKAIEGEDALEEFINHLIQELKVIMFLVGAKNISELSKAPAIIMGKTREWLSIRGLNPENYSHPR